MFYSAFGQSRTHRHMGHALREAGMELQRYYPPYWVIRKYVGVIQRGREGTGRLLTRNKVSRPMSRATGLIRVIILCVRVQTNSSFSTSMVTCDTRPRYLHAVIPMHCKSRTTSSHRHPQLQKVFQHLWVARYQ